MSCFPFPTTLLTLISSKNALSFLWKPLSFFFSRWHVVISAWLLLMQFNLILLETSYSSYICFIIQQLIGTFHNCWYEKDKKKQAHLIYPNSSELDRIYISWISKVCRSPDFPIFMGEGMNLSTRMTNVCIKLLMVVPRQIWLQGIGNVGGQHSSNPLTTSNENTDTQKSSCSIKIHETP